MKLFGQLVRTVVNTALLPVEIVKDATTLGTDLVDVTNILRDHLFITGEFGTSLALYFDIKAVLKQRMRR